MWTGNALAGTLKSRRAGQGTGVTSKQLNFSKRTQIMLRYSGSVKKGGKGLQDIKQQILKSLLNLWCTTKKLGLLKMQKKKHFLLNMPSGK